MHIYPNTHFSALLLAIGAVTQAGCSLSVIEGPPPEDAGAESTSTQSTQTSSSDERGGDDASTTDGPSSDPTSTVDPSTDDGHASTDNDDTSTDEAGVDPSPGTGDSNGPATSNETSSSTDAGGPNSVIDRGTCGADLTNATVVSRVSGNTTWSGTILVSEPITVGNVELTIAPGTHVVFAADAGLTIGRYSEQTTTLIAEGTDDDPIIFCGAEAVPGFWTEIHIGRLTKSNSSMSHVKVFDGGGKDVVAALSLVAAVDVNDVAISNSASAGLSAEDFGDDSARLTITNSKAAVILETPEALDRFPLGGSFSDNDENVASLAFTSTQSPTVYHNLGIPYVHAETVALGPDVTIEAGVNIVFGPDAEFLIGRYSGDEGTFRVLGTESAPVLFNGRDNEPGFWRGVAIHALASTASELRYTTIRNAGASDYNALHIDASILLDHVTVENNDRGVFIGWDGLDSDSSSLTVSGTNEGLPLYLQPDALTSIPAGSTFTGNTLDRIEILPGTYRSDGALVNPGIPYYIASELHIANGTFVPPPGTQFIMGADAKLTSAQFSGDAATFILAGTEAEPIVFSGAEATPGYWDRVTVGPRVESTANVEWVEFDGGGGNDGSAMLYLSASTPVTNCTFTNSASGGIDVPSDDSTDYSAANTFSNNAGADVVQ